MPIAGIRPPRPVICVNTNERFRSANAAAKWCGLASHADIIKTCQGTVPRAGRHPDTGEMLVWKFAEE